MTKEKDNAMTKRNNYQQSHDRSYQKPSIWFRLKEGTLTIAGVLWTVVLFLFHIIMLIMVTPLIIIYFLWNLAKGALFGTISLVIGKFLIAFVIVFRYDGENTVDTLLGTTPYLEPAPSHMPPSTSHWINWWLGGTRENMQIISQWWDYAFIITFAIVMAVTLTFSPHE